MAGAGQARAGDALAVVVHGGWTSPDSISLATLRQLYLGHRTRLGGRRVQCIDLPAGSPARGAFSEAVLGSSERALERYWLRRALEGGPPPPRELASAAAVLAHVAREPRALAYVALSALGDPPAGIRILAIEVEGKRVGPTDPAYPVRLPEPAEPAPSS